MIVPMKKVSLIMQEKDRKRALKALRRLGVLHMEITQGGGERLAELQERLALLNTCTAVLSEKWDKSGATPEASGEDMTVLARKTAALIEEKERLRGEERVLMNELERLRVWGELDPAAFAALKEKGLSVSLCEMPTTIYDKTEIAARVILLERTKAVVRLMVIGADEEAEALISSYRIRLPACSTEELKEKLASAQKRMRDIDGEVKACAVHVPNLKTAIASLEKEIEFETYATGMDGEVLQGNAGGEVRLVYFTGYLPADDLKTLQQTAAENAWGLLAEDPTPDDNAPTQLKNNKFVSLIYPLTDFLGTVPGYFEYDISAWFLGFILVFFGIIFGDGGYGLLICAVAGALILGARLGKKPVAPAFWLILLMGGATVLWGVLTCTWFGIAPEHLPAWMRAISLPVISNVYADKIWYPFWTGGEVGLTTTQNLQILCFALALIQLSAAHIKGLVRNRRSLKLLGDLGAVLQLIGIFYIVLSLVVNGEVFGLGLVISGIPVGITAIVLIGVGFLLNFVFANYDGNIGQSVLASLKGIVSVLLGVVNVFSDIVSYIRLWAVGLAGAAISATVNELASPMLGNLMFMVFAILLLVFGHGLNMILNVLSVIVHGVRLNTLEFSTHLDMSWSGHKYRPFEE